MKNIFILPIYILGFLLPTYLEVFSRNEKTNDIRIFCQLTWKFFFSGMKKIILGFFANLPGGFFPEMKNDI
tara:strand:- start:80 stop:292 length:213 start_codon:yes stop_codon:yes gene_type:complete